jgi:hypothetical protein
MSQATRNFHIDQFDPRVFDCDDIDENPAHVVRPRHFKRNPAARRASRY